MSRPANFRRPVRLSLQVLRDAGTVSFPVNVLQLCRHYGIRLKTYEDLDIAWSGFRGEDAFLDPTLLSGDGFSMDLDGRFVIAFNKTRGPKERIRFTVAHELGHLLLGHHAECGKTVLHRGASDRAQDKVFEDEANCFARNLLSPALAVQELFRAHGLVTPEHDASPDRTVWRSLSSAPRLPDLPDSLTDSLLLRRAFFVTASAARTRCAFLKEDLQNTPVAEAAELLREIRFDAQWRCPACGALHIPGASSCRVCGSGRRADFRTKASTERLPLFRPATPEDRSFCGFCGNGSFPRDTDFCPVCGGDVPTPVYLFPARYPVHEEISFTAALFPSGVPYDPVTFRARQCPRCGKDGHDPDADFCTVCGADLRNLCSGGEDLSGEFGRHPNPPGARFCRRCNAKLVL